MKHDKSSCKVSASAAEAVPVSLRAMYADAMRQVMADPNKAIAEHDPWLAELLGARRSSTSGKG